MSVENCVLNGSFLRLYDIFMDFVSVDPYLYNKSEKKLVLPIVPMNMLVELLECVTKVFQNEKTLLEIPIPVCVIGDLHGHILDLFRIINSNGSPMDNNYLFLGDLVDRGEFSTETVIFVFLLKVLFPNRVYLIRGNHEFKEMSIRSGFFTEVYHIYNDESIIQLFERAFSFIPIAGFVGQLSLCVHGGIGQNFQFFYQLEEINRPIISFNDPVVIDLLWSDPHESEIMFGKSPRGFGSLFNEEATKNFLTQANKSFIIRGHECVMNGYETKHHGRVITVFSASNYCNTPNKSAILKILDEYRYLPQYYDPIPVVLRKDTCFISFEGLCKKYLKPSISAIDTQINPENSARRKSRLGNNMSSRGYYDRMTASTRDIRLYSKLNR